MNGASESSLVVEHRLPKPRAAGSNPVSRSIIYAQIGIAGVAQWQSS